MDRKEVAVPQPQLAAEGNAGDPVVDLTSEDEDAPESAAESEPAQPVTNIEERRDSNSSSAMTPAPQSEEGEKGTNRYNS